jgi:hypothetical protein
MHREKEYFPARNAADDPASMPPIFYFERASEFTSPFSAPI